MKRRNTLKDFLLPVLFFSLIVALTCSSAYAATVTTDKLDYAPGEIVIITGSGWGPGETVTLLLHEEPSIDPDTWFDPSPVADPDGNIYDEFVVQPNDVGMTFTLTATGLSSGLMAQTTFTDAPKVVSVSVGDQSPSQIIAGQSATYTITVTRDGACNSFTANLTITGLPAGASASFLPNPITLPDPCPSGSITATTTLTITTTLGTTPIGTTTFAVKAERVNNDYATGDGTLIVVQCITDSNCNDNIGCTVDTCVNNVCVITPNNSLCDDQNVCTNDVCAVGIGCQYTAGNAGAVCRAATGACDLAESCTGSSATCPTDTFKPNTEVCNASAGVCDVEEKCTGSSAACPDDGYETAGTECRASAGDCDVTEVCSGSSAACPPDGFKTASIECRGSAGDCDVAENCPGNGPLCPPDGFKDDTDLCRASANICDAVEYCTGYSANCPEDLPAECSLVTSSSLCTFNIDTLADNQFRLILTPDHTFTAATAWKLNASNPGQFFYNILYIGDRDETLTITLPYPFVTQGAMPIHIYDGVTITTDNETLCFTPGNEIANGSTPVTLENYGNGMGSTTTVNVDLPDLSKSGGIAYINMHLDYGLKHTTTGYSKNANNDAIDAITSAVRIPNQQGYDFSNSTAPGDTVYSLNAFKRDPGIGGLVLESGTDNPVSNVKVQIYDSKSKLLATVYTDADGWYMWQYKYTGKPATFTIKLPDYNLIQSVTLKSNGFVVGNFTLP